METQTEIKQKEDFPDVIQAKKWGDKVSPGDELTIYGTGASPNKEPIQSTNYKGGASGWKLNPNGEVEIKGTIPASASAAGVAGTIAISTSHIYVCTATNTWKRVAIATW